MFGFLLFFVGTNMLFKDVADDEKREQNTRYNAATIDQNVGYCSCALGNEQLMNFIGNGIGRANGKGNRKTASVSPKIGERGASTVEPQKGVGAKMGKLADKQMDRFYQFCLLGGA